MHALVIENARIVTLSYTRPDAAPKVPGLDGLLESPHRGPAEERSLGVIERGWVACSGDRIESVGSGPAPRGHERYDARGRVLMPGFVDCHTHACWAGSRFDEADQRIAGVPYLQILAAGGGIMSTVRATRAASMETLVSATLARARAALAMGTTTLEIKSGYGLAPEPERRMLDAIHAAGHHTPQRIVPTFLGAHAKDPANPHAVDETVGTTLPAICAAYPGIACDAYCEEGAWSRDECERLFRRAIALGSPIRVHADQFNSLGMTSLAIELGARSVDHLEATTDEELRRLAGSGTIGVALPGCGFHMDMRFARGRMLLDLGGALAIATNCNPGSSPTISMPFIIALAVRFLRLTPAEAILAATRNAAHVLGLGAELGSIAVGKRADLQVLATDDERALAYEYAMPGPDALWIAGRRVVG